MRRDIYIYRFYSVHIGINLNDLYSLFRSVTVTHEAVSDVSPPESIIKKDTSGLSKSVNTSLAWHFN